MRMNSADKVSVSDAENENLKDNIGDDAVSAAGGEANSTLNDSESGENVPDDKETADSEDSSGSEEKIDDGLDTDAEDVNSVSELERSLDEFQENDVPLTEAELKSRNRERVNSIIRTVLMLVSISLFLYSIFIIAQTLYDYKRTNDIYDDLANMIFTDSIYDEAREENQLTYAKKLSSSGTTPNFYDSMTSGVQSDISYTVESSTYNEEFEKMKVSLHNLQLQNSDLYGWITIENTDINYPVMQYTDNDYYLGHAYSGVELPSGSIFCDYRCYKDIMKNYNTILYGHNMYNGTMFNQVTKFLDEEFFNENKYIKIYTLDGIYTYEVFSIYETKYDYPYITTGFKTREEFVEFAERVRSNSKYVREGIEFTETDRILTLSTCTNGFWTGRYALHAVLVNVVN